MQAADLSALDGTVTAPQPQPKAPFWSLRVLLLNFSDRAFFQWRQQKRGGIFVTEVLPECKLTWLGQATLARA